MILNRTDLAKHKSTCNTHQQWWLCVCVELMDKGGLCCYDYIDTLANETNLTHTHKTFVIMASEANRGNGSAFIMAWWWLHVTLFWPSPHDCGSAADVLNWFFSVHPFEFFQSMLVNIIYKSWRQSLKTITQDRSQSKRFKKKYLWASVQNQSVQGN